jgi:hypothetical protein
LSWHSFEATPLLLPGIRLQTSQADAAGAFDGERDVLSATCWRASKAGYM